ncbi:MAG: glycosyltransferase family 1 protein [Acidimicrobiales bacterium]|nr:glycosyltransferase family 1 protein [Acidimicrobiales bacterium]
MTGLRVGIDVTALLGPPTGVHRVTRSLIAALADDERVDVSGWLLSARGARPPIDVTVRRSRVPAALAQRVWARSALLGRIVTGPVDVAHGPNFLAPPTARSVISLQDTTPLLHPEWCRPEVAAKAPAIRHAIAAGALVHVSSALVGAEAVEQLGAAPAQVHLVHHAVEPVAEADPAVAHGLVGADRYLLVLGTVEHRKNVVAAVRAMADVDEDVHLVISGPAGNAEPELDAALDGLDRRRIHRLPAVDDRTRNSLLRNATALLWPSRYEGFALPPLEALSVGTPIVATAVGALPELVGDQVALVPPGDDDAFTGAVTQLVTDDATVPAAVTARIAELTWTRAADAMVAVYEAAAGR